MKSGNRRAFEFIYNKEIKALLLYAKRFTNDDSLIEDAVHDVFVYIWQNKEGLKDVDQIKPYLFVSLRHKVVNTIKKNQKTEHKELNDSFLEKEDSIEGKIIQTEFKAELSNQLQESFKTLSTRQREAIYLKYYEGLAYEDICTSMNINYQSVRNLISTGIKKLHLNLKNKKGIK